MYFQSDHLYHIYNQGNNRQKIFFSENNYLYFLRKLKNYLLPYGDLLAWCLMPNHFHLLVFVHSCQLKRPNGKSRTLNDSIGIMLRSYTRAINKEAIRSGSLFREETKAVCLTKPQDIKNTWYSKGIIKEVIVENPEIGYPNICFNYILQNPVRAGLVHSASAWKYSSLSEYMGLVPGTMLNTNRIKEFELNYFISDGVNQSHPVKSGMQKKKNALRLAFTNDYCTFAPAENRTP